MADCCDPIPYRRFFNRKEAERNARAYRKRGLGSISTKMVDYLVAQGVEGKDLLEVGGGVGAIQLELLKAGVASSLNVEMSAGYDDAAKKLAQEAGFEERITRRVGDFVDLQDDVDPADVVVMNRVVCCYPFMERMMTAAVSKTGRYLALSFPREKWWTKFTFGVGNRYMALRRCEFRGYVHPVADIERVATDAGLKVRHSFQNISWTVLVLERAA